MNIYKLNIEDTIENPLLCVVCFSAMYIYIYNIDRTLRALWLVKNLCFIRV